MPLWLEFTALMLLTYSIGLALGWVIWGRKTWGQKDGGSKT